MNYSQGYDMCCEVEPEKVTAAAREQTIKESLTQIESGMVDVRSVLLNIYEGIANNQRTDDKLTAPGCMQDSTRNIKCLTEECLSLANKIHGLLF